MLVQLVPVSEEAKHFVKNHEPFESHIEFICDEGYSVDITKGDKIICRVWCDKSETNWRVNL